MLQPLATAAATRSVLPVATVQRTEYSAMIMSTARPLLFILDLRGVAQVLLPYLSFVATSTPAASSSSTTPHSPCILACINGVAPLLFASLRAPAACVGAMSITTTTRYCPIGMDCVCLLLQNL